MWEVVPGSTGRGMRKGDKEGGVIKQVTTVGNGKLSPAEPWEPERNMPTGPGVQEYIHRSLVESCSLDVLILQHCRVAKQLPWQVRALRQKEEGRHL